LSSLQSTYIRNSILRALRETRPDAAKLVSASFVYEHPTIERIATFLSKAVADPHSTQSVDLTVRGRELQALVDTYTEGFPPRVTLNGSAYPELCGDVYLLTGTTGSLGSNMLAQLLEAPEVTCVYAFNRPSKAATLRARQLSAFKERGLNTDLLSSEKLVYVEGDLSAPGFALGDELYGEVSISPSLRLVVAPICDESHRSINQSRTSFTTVRHFLFHHTTPAELLHSVDD
jgi:Male sterility protein